MPRTKATPAPVTPDAPDVRLVPIDSLHLDPRNVRTHPDKNLTAIRDSLRAFGQQKPLVVTQDGLILAGNGTWSAAKQLGWTHVAVQVSTLDPDQARAYAVADNRTGELALWDETALAETLQDLYEQALPLPGWEPGDLERLWGPAPLVEVEPEVERANVLRQEYGVEVGQVWTLGDHRLACGDCTDTAVVERVMAGMLAHVIFTDPPYGVDYDGGTLPRKRLAGDDTTMLYGPACTMAAHFSEPKAPLYLWHAGIKGIAAAAAAAAAGYEIRCEIVWNKNLAQYGALSAQYKQKHEPCYYCFKRGETPYWYGPTNEVTVWDCSRAQVNEYHPTQKPVELPARALRNSSTQGNIVLDLFLGAGSTLLACEQLQRICYGIEIDPGYVAVTLHRWATLTGETPVLVEG